MLAACASDDDSTAETLGSSLAWVVDDPDFELCTTRLAYDAAISAVDRPPIESGDPLGELDKIEPPAKLAGDWPDLLLAAAAAVDEGVEVEDLSDHALSERALEVGRRVDVLVIDTPCDPTGLPEAFGCRAPIRSCAEDLANGSGDDFATAFLLEVASLEAWNKVVCFDAEYFEEHGATDLEPQPLCIFTLTDGPTGEIERASVQITFARSTDDRWIAWEAK